MPSYRELLQQIRAEIAEVDAPGARELLDSIDPPLLVDVREQDEWNEGHLPGAVHIPRGNLESRIERAAPDRSGSIVLYCQSGNRSAFAAKTLEELGYENVVSLAGGFTDWKRNGFPTQLPRVLDAEKRSRYSRHLLIPEVGEEGAQDQLWAGQQPADHEQPNVGSKLLVEEILDLERTTSRHSASCSAVVGGSCGMSRVTNQ